MDRLQKQQAVAELKEVFTTSSTVVVAHYRGMSVNEVSDFRSLAKKNGANVKVTKNTLAKIASNDTDFVGLQDYFSGPTAISYSEDAVAAAKVVVDFAKNNEKLIVIGGSFNGQMLDDSEVKALANTPSLDESRAKVVGLLTAAAGNLVQLVQTPGGNVARTISARSKQAE